VLDDLKAVHHMHNVLFEVDVVHVVVGVEVNRDDVQKDVRQAVNNEHNVNRLVVIYVMDLVRVLDYPLCDHEGYQDSSESYDVHVRQQLPLLVLDLVVLVEVRFHGPHEPLDYVKLNKNAFNADEDNQRVDEELEG